MTELKIFIASSHEVEEERRALEKFINEESNRYLEFGLHLKPEMWELLSRKFEHKRKQEMYTKKLLESDVVIFMFGTRVGDYTREEFEAACKARQKGENPKYIFAYFKNANIETYKLVPEKLDELNGIIELKNYIDTELQQVYDWFFNQIDLQLKVQKELHEIILPIVTKENSQNFADTKIDDFVNLYNGIRESFQVAGKNTIVDSAINQLYLLQKYNIQPKLSELSEKDFYNLCKKIIDSAQSGSEIKALSMMLKSEWTNSDEEVGFWKANLNAVKRKVVLERIFVVNRSEAHRLKSIPQILNHVDYGNEYLQSYIVEKELLSSEYPKLLEKAGNGFLLINDTINRIALLDSDPDSGMRGTPVFDKVELEKLERLFEDMRGIATSLKKYLDKINLSHYKKEMLSVFVTTECNLSCDYCFTNKYEDAHRNQTVDIDFVKKGIDDYFKTDYLRHIRFFGAGEPTVKLSLIKEICRYAREKGGDSVTFEIQTNGSFSEDAAVWISQNINIIWISCDGTPDIHDSHRKCLDSSKKSSDLIEKNIKIIKRYDNFVGIRATITNENINRQIEMIKYFNNLGIKHIWVDPIFPSVGETVSENTFDNMLFAEKFLDACKFAETCGIFYGSILTCNFADSVTKHCRACLPVPHLTTDGYVSACDMALFGKDENHMSQYFIYGKWNETKKEIEYDNNKIDRLRSRDINNMEHCRECNSKEHCGGYCLGEVLNETKDLFGQKKGVCEAIRYLDSEMTESQRKYAYTHP